MKKPQLKQKSGVAVLMLLLLLIFQGCSKDDTLKPVDFHLDPAIKEANDPKNLDGPIPESCRQVCLMAGQNTKVGTVDVAMKNENLYVTYNITTPNVYLKEVYLDVFRNTEQFEGEKKMDNGGAIPGKFIYKLRLDAKTMKSSHTVVIPASYLAKVGAGCFNIVSHAALSNGETVWGGLCSETETGVSIDEARLFPGKNWSVYFGFCPEECAKSVDFTYAWEDLMSDSNDSDYNDLVIKSAVLKFQNELKISFTADARGSGFDHQFKIKIPKAGISGIYGHDSHTEDADFYYITVFKSTKAAFQKSFANTNTEEGCTPVTTKEIVLKIDNSFPFNPAVPYEPFISVYPSGSTNSGEFYDLYIYEVSGTGTWTDPSGKIFPNGIIIPVDWAWPTEWTKISMAYPDFSSITDGWNPDWANNLADPTKVFNTGDCE